MTGGRAVTRRVYIGLLLAALAAVAVLIAVMRSAVKHEELQTVPTASENLTVTIDQQAFNLRDGVAELPAAPGTATKNTLRVVGSLVPGDINDDGKLDTALLLANDPGGSGTFYYGVVAVNDGGAYRASNALPLGDRIKPQGIHFTDGRFVYRFLDRKPGEPMAAEPSVEKTVVVAFDPASDSISAVS